MRIRAVFLGVLLAGCSAGPGSTPTVAQPDRLLVFGASGRIGGAITSEALERGYAVTGVTRDRTRLAGRYTGLKIAEGNILDRQRLAELIRQHDAILVSIGGAPEEGQQPTDYIAATAARSLIEVLEPQADAGPRLLFVGNLFTLEQEPGVTLIEAGRADGHRYEVMFRSHQLALDDFRASSINWTVATPPNGLRLKGRTGRIRWGTDQLLREPDGTPSTISPEDFAFAMLEELERGRYVGRRYTVATDTGSPAEPDAP